MDVLLALLGAAAMNAAATPSAAPLVACFVSWEDGRLEIQADRPVRVTQFRLKDPERRILDVHGAELGDIHTPGHITVGTGGVRQVRIARHPDKATVRVVLDLEAKAELTLQTFEGGRRLLAWPDSGEPLGPPAPKSAETLIGPTMRSAAVASAAVAPASGSRPEAGAPGVAIGSLLGPPAPGEAVWQVGPPVAQAPGPRPSRPHQASRLPQAPRPASSPPSPLASVPTPAPDEVVPEASASRAVPWPAAPQVVESIRLRHYRNETTLEIRSRSQLMAWVQDEWQAGRLTVRVPRSSVACELPRARGAVSRMALRREEESWALALELGSGQHVFESAPIDDGRGLRIRMRPAPKLDLDKPLVMIDPGHGGYDPGALGAGGGNESQVTLDVAKLVFKALADLGIQPILTRTMDAEVRLPDRVALMERYNPAAFVSLHCNSSEAPEATGVETYYRHDSGSKLSRMIHEKVVAATGRQDRGVRSGRLYVLRGEQTPSTLVEMGFISSREEETRLKDPAFQKAVARAVAEGVKAYLDSRPALSAGGSQPTL